MVTKTVGKLARKAAKRAEIGAWVDEKPDGPALGICGTAAGVEADLLVADPHGLTNVNRGTLQVGDRGVPQQQRTESEVFLPHNLEVGDAIEVAELHLGLGHAGLVEFADRRVRSSCNMFDTANDHSGERKVHALSSAGSGAGRLGSVEDGGCGDGGEESHGDVQAVEGDAIRGASIPSCTGGDGCEVRSIHRESRVSFDDRFSWREELQLTASLSVHLLCQAAPAATETATAPTAATITSHVCITDVLANEDASCTLNQKRHRGDAYMNVIGVYEDGMNEAGRARTGARTE